MLSDLKKKSFPCLEGELLKGGVHPEVSMWLSGVARDRVCREGRRGEGLSSQHKAWLQFALQVTGSRTLPHGRSWRATRLQRELVSESSAT